jgi:hypothetical protein
MKTAAIIPLADVPSPIEQIRERAYFRWLELGRPEGEDLVHWFWARQQIIAPDLSIHPRPAPPASSAGHLPFENTAATRSGASSHRFHDRQTPRDARLDVVAGEARQRIRGRHSDRSLRAQPKSREQ